MPSPKLNFGMNGFGKPRRDANTHERLLFDSCSFASIRGFNSVWSQGSVGANRTEEEVCGLNHEGTRIHTNSYSLIHSLSDVASVIIEIIHDELVGEVGSSAVFPACTIGSFEAERRRIHSYRFAA